MPRPDLRATSRFPDLEIPGRDRLIQLLRRLLSTRGDILIRGATYVKRLAIGTAGQILRSDGTDIAWESPGIADDKILEVDATDGAPNDDEYARFTATGLEGRTTAQVKSDLAIDHGADLAGLDDDDHAQYVKDTEFTAANDTLVGTGSGTFAKKTPAELLAILSGDAGAAFDWNDNILQKVKGLLLTTATELTMDTNGAITVTQMVHTVDTFEDAASDDLVTINGGTTVGLVVIRPAHTDRTVVVKDGGGNIELLGGADITLDDITDHVMLFWDTTNSKWVDVGAGGGGLSADSVDKTHLSQDFGAAGGRLHNFIPTPIAGKPLQVDHSTDTPFTAKINGSPTATSVVYDGDSNEGMFNTLVPWDGTNYWGKLVLHNTTRSNSRLIEAVDIATNTITTESSTDDWADNDDLTCQSQVNAGAQFVDLDLSDKVPTTTKSILFFVEFIDRSAGAQSTRGLYLHPYDTWNLGKKLVVYCDLASERTTIVFPMEVISQKITIAIDNCTDVIYALTVIGYFEYADT